MEQPDGTAQDSPDPPDPIEIEQAARAWGIETDYWDIWGKQHHASAELETAILASLGVDTSSKRVAPRRPWSAAASASGVRLSLRPSFSLPEGRRTKSLFRCPRLRRRRRNAANPTGRRSARLNWRLRWARFHGRALAHVRLPDDLPLGYHEITLEIAGETSRPSRLIVCPSRAFEPAWLETGRAAGLAISLYGLRSQRNWGCGDTTDLKALTDWVAERTGTSFIALNPLHAIPNRQPYNTSPYLPNSIFYRNPIYLDIEAIPDFAASARAAALFQSPAVQKEIADAAQRRTGGVRARVRVEASFPEIAVSSVSGRMARWHAARG